MAKGGQYHDNAAWVIAVALIVGVFWILFTAFTSKPQADVQVRYEPVNVILEDQDGNQITEVTIPRQP